MGEITEEKALVYRIMIDNFLKLLSGLVSLGILIWVVYYMLEVAETWQVKAVYGSVSSILSYTTFKVYAHYFPAAKVAGTRKSKTLPKQ